MLLAHQGGWDEALLVMVPITFIFVVLWFAKRKAERLGEGSTSEPHETGSGSSVDGSTGAVNADTATAPSRSVES